MENLKEVFKEHRVPLLIHFLTKIESVDIQEIKVIRNEETNKTTRISNNRVVFIKHYYKAF